MRDARATAEKFAHAWSRRDWRAAATLAQPTWKAGHADPEAALEGLLGEIRPGPEPETSKPELLSSVLADVAVTLQLEDREAPVTLTFRLIRERGPFWPSPVGNWFVNPVSVLRGLSEG